MKKAFYWTVALLSVIYSCTQKEMEIVTPEEPETELIQLTIKASIGETDGTKTAIQSDGTSIYWTQGDAINLFYGELSAGQFTSSITTPSQSTDFSGTLSVATGTTEAGMTARRFWGVYPYNAANSCDGSGVTLTIPSAQKGVPGTFTDKLNPTVATSPGLDLTFYNVGSWFIFSVTQENVVSATLRGNNNEDIAGTIRVTMDSNSRPVATVQSGAKSITITPQAGVSFEVGELYYIVLIPQTLSGGYTLTLTKADGSSADCVVSKEAAFARSSYRRKRDADSGLVYVREGNIDFADAAVKTICVNRWDTDNDGELSYTEAAAVTSIPYSAFAGNTTITTFDEFQYFTGVTSLGYDSDYDEGMDYYGTFYNCTSLTSITLPPTLKTISYACFRGCIGLTEITIPASVTTIQQIAFLGCENLDVYMESETPCTLQKDNYGTYDEPYVFGFLTSGKVKTIYVPTQECVDTYKNATYWKTYQFKIKWVGEAAPVSTIPEGAVDLGLSVKWASYNIGATSPEEYGDYFAWGETSPQSNNKYSWDSYSWSAQGDSHSFTKYCSNPNYGNYYCIWDRNYILDPTDDVAVVKLGDKWRMPTESEMDELRNQCTWTWVDDDERTGYIVSSQANGNSIFLPAAGRRYNNQIESNSGNYWTSSIGSGDSRYAKAIWFSSSSTMRFDCTRSCGLTIRPVYSDSNIPVSYVSNYEFQQIELTPGNSYTLRAYVSPELATNPSVFWSSSNPSVAAVSSEGRVSAVSEGEATITMTTEDGGKTATCMVIVSPETELKYVDLGLSVKWSAKNVGAALPEDYGVLLSWDEAISTDLGAGWRLPTSSDWKELTDNCTWTWEAKNGNRGLRVVSKINGNSLFLPACGYKPNNNHLYSGRKCFYWLSNEDPSNSSQALIRILDANGSNNVLDSSLSKSHGSSVRAVYE